MSVTRAAREMGISRQTLHRILAGTHSITPENALRIGKFCGNGGQLWLAMQHGHDLWHAERRMKAELARIPTHAEKPQRRKKSA
jgi:addiction module HigA family antidote